MMTATRHLSNKKIQGIIKWHIHLFWIISILFMFIIFFQNKLAAEETFRIKAGMWKGTFLTHDGTRYKLKYIVSYGKASKKGPVKIKMINTDLEPVSEFTYKLTDIQISNKQLRFKIPQEFETKDCVLDWNDDAYSGTCTSTAGKPEETSEITMVPVYGSQDTE